MARFLRGGTQGGWLRQQVLGRPGLHRGEAHRNFSKQIKMSVEFTPKGHWGRREDLERNDESSKKHQKLTPQPVKNGG